VTQYGFAENVDGFSSGKIAQMIFWSTIAGPIFNKEKSTVAEKTATASVPRVRGRRRGHPGRLGRPASPRTSIPRKRPPRGGRSPGSPIRSEQVRDRQIPDRRKPNLGFQDPELLKRSPTCRTPPKRSPTPISSRRRASTSFFQMNDVMNVEFN